MKIFWKIAPWLSRLILVPPTLIFTLIAIRYITKPTQAAAEVGISLNTPLAATVLRIGFGAFPLGAAIFTLWCLVSTRRILTGLTFVGTMLGVALIVRVFGMMVDGTVRESMGLVRAEAILLIICFIGVAIELSRQRQPIERAT